MSTANSRDGDDDPFTILGVSRTCTPSELKQVYRELARRYHPDINPGAEAAAQMKRINLAYDHALAQIERTARLRSMRASAMTVATQRQQPPPVGVAQVFGRGIRIARTATPRRGRRRGLWLSLVAGVVIAALVAFLVVRTLTLPASPSIGVHGAPVPLLRLGGGASFTWPESGAITLTERLITRLPPGVHLNEAPQWSADGAYVALSLAPTGSNGAAANDASTVQVLQGRRVLTTLPGTSARWSPVANELAVLTRPGDASGPLLELVSPLSSGAPTILDTNAATHLAWSDDGAQIAYSANGQQQLRVTSVTNADAAPRTLVKTHGQRLIPLGWQGNQIVEIAHDNGAISLVGIDAALGESVPLADVDALATETTVVVSRDGVAYVSQTATSPFVTFHWLGSTSQQRWSAQLPGVQSVRFLAGWAADSGWLALAPGSAATTNDASAGTSEICLTRSPRSHAAPPPTWPLHCLLIPGILEGMSWEPHTSMLSYVRQTQPGGALELRALHIQRSPAQARTARAGASQTDETHWIARSAAWSVAKISIFTERSRRHYCGATQHCPTPFSAWLARLDALPFTSTG